MGFGKYQKVGSFQISKKGQVVISDPSYPLGTWCQGVVNNVSPGKWYAFIRYSQDDMFGDRIATLVAVHSRALKTFKVGAGYEFPINLWALFDFEVGVDSGQAGIFDKAVFNKAPLAVRKLKSSGYWKPEELKTEQDVFYDRMCALTCENNRSRAGTFKYGAVSSSGYGDGGYDAFGYRKAGGNYLGLAIEFIPQELDA